MCVLSNFNSILQSNNYDVINKFMDNCESNCHKYGSCDYYSMLDDRLKELDIKCPRCGKRLSLSTIKGYKYQCMNCDEDFYSFEVE